MTLLFYLSFFRFASGIRDFFCRLTRLIVLLRKAVGRWYSERVRLDHRTNFEVLAVDGATRRLVTAASPQHSFTGVKMSQSQHDREVGDWKGRRFAAAPQPKPERDPAAHSLSEHARYRIGSGERIGVAEIFLDHLHCGVASSFHDPEHRCSGEVRASHACCARAMAAIRCRVEANQLSRRLYPPVHSLGIHSAMHLGSLVGHRVKQGARISATVTQPYPQRAYGARQFFLPEPDADYRALSLLIGLARCYRHRHPTSGDKAQIGVVQRGDIAAAKTGGARKEYERFVAYAGDRPHAVKLRAHLPQLTHAERGTPPGLFFPLALGAGHRLPHFGPVRRLQSLGLMIVKNCGDVFFGGRDLRS